MTQNGHTSINTTTINVRPHTPVRNGVDGWVLEDMDWDPVTGIATFEYFNKQTEHTHYEYRMQPTHEGHAQWAVMSSMPRKTLSR